MAKRKSSLISAIQTKDIETENGMPTHSTSGDSVMDLFFKQGASRANIVDLVGLFSSAFKENVLLSVKSMFYNRDIRGGQGERDTFRAMLTWLAVNKPKIAEKVLHLVPEYGRWDDLLAVVDTPVEHMLKDLILENISNVLLRKWMPRENKSKGDVAKKLMKLLGVNAVEYRKMFSTNDETVENFMTSKRWSEINYSHVPSVASSRLRTAFHRNDGERYTDYLEKLEKGDKSVKINAGAIYPNDVIKSYLNRGKSSNTPDKTVEAQWKALPDFVGDVNALAVIDTSGSMQSDLAWEVAYSLGIYLAERNKSIFKDVFITFSTMAKMVHLTGSTLLDKVNVIRGNAIVSNTNFESVFNLILDKAVGYKVPQEDMPDMLIVISDMQFDECVDGSSNTAMEMMKKKYAKAGYIMPQIIFWNVRSSNGVPAKINEQGVALVSGYSPSIMKSVLGGQMTPLGMMEKVLNSERYEAVEKALS